MARPRKTPEELRLSDSGKHNAGRYAERLDAETPLDVRPLGGPPKQNIITFEEAWAEILDMCPEGVLRHSDSLIVEQAARVHQLLRNTAALAALEGNPLPPIEVKYVKQLESLLARLGATPSDRSKVVTPAKKVQTDAFD